MRFSNILSNRSARTGAAFALCAMIGSACGGDDAAQPGALVIPFTLGNHKDCASVGVKVVRAELDDPMLVEEALCESGQVRFQEVPPGNYHVRLFGVDRTGVATMDSLQATDTRVAVIGDGSTVIAEPAVTLTAAPARILLRWSFGFGSCETAGIDRFSVTAWRNDGSALLLDTDVPCKMLGDGAEQYRVVPDLDRTLSGDEVGEVNVQAVDKDGVAMGKAATFTFAPPGPGRSVKLSATCSDGACGGTGTPD